MDGFSEDVVLLKQQEKTKQGVFFYINISSAILVMIICVLFVLRVVELIIIVLPLFLFCIYSTIILFEKRVVENKLKKIKDTKSQTTKIECKKLKVLVCYARGGKCFVYALVFKDSKGKRYYYVHPLERTSTFEKNKALKQKHERKTFFVECYANTNIIKNHDL